jgi:hypothetical protein
MRAVESGENIGLFVAEYGADLERLGFDTLSVWCQANLCAIPPDIAADVLTGRLNSAEPFQAEFEAMIGMGMNQIDTTPEIR